VLVDDGTGKLIEGPNDSEFALEGGFNVGGNVNLKLAFLDVTGNLDNQTNLMTVGFFVDVRRRQDLLRPQRRRQTDA
jgi:hypothetical protein